MTVVVYHSPRKHYLPENNYFRIIFWLPFHDFDFFELISENYPIPIAFVWVVWHYPVGTPVLVELFFITITRFDFFRINWVMFSWQMVVFFGLGPTGFILFIFFCIAGLEVFVPCIGAAGSQKYPKELLGWRVCRTTLPRKVWNSKTKVVQNPFQNKSRTESEIPRKW